MADEFDRLDLSEISAEQMDLLERTMPSDWPEAWREFAVSCYITLVSEQAANAESCASRAIRIARGIAEDMGGQQPYIPVGADLMATARARRVVELLDQRMSYKEVAKATDLTESGVRKIERAWRRQQIVLRQGVLALE